MHRLGALFVTLLAITVIAARATPAHATGVKLASNDCGSFGAIYLSEWQDWAFASWQEAWYGVYDVGYHCPPVSVKNKTWGSIKALYH